MKRIWNFNVLGLLMVVMIFGSLNSLAQDDEAPLTDEELRKYALVMDFAEQEMEKLKTDYNDMIQAEELMDGGRRFKELKDVADDSLKLVETATPEELAVFNKIESANNENIEAFKAAYTDKIKNKDELGAALYNRITKEMKSDEELKARYQAILEEVQSERMADAEGTDESEEGDTSAESQ